jgi:uncharacterized protein (TIGR02453 family)
MMAIKGSHRIDPLEIPSPSVFIHGRKCLLSGFDQVYKCVHMGKGLISTETFHFLKNLAQNNTREWFNYNKVAYQRAHEETKAFLHELHFEMNKVDEIEKSKLFRIYRDVRFSKDKTPYNPSFRMSLARMKPWLRGGYFLKISPADSGLACGFWNPNSVDMNRIRAAIASDHQRFRSVISGEGILGVFGGMQGEQVKTAPKGYRNDHPAIEFLRYKQFLFSRQFTDKEVCSNDFISHCTDAWLAIRPFFNYMSDILTHSTDGEPLYDSFPGMGPP